MCKREKEETKERIIECVKLLIEKVSLVELVCKIEGFIRRMIM